MKIETKSKQFQNALAKAIEKKPLVKIGAKENEYLVRGSEGNFYPVNFERSSAGAMFEFCQCAGAMGGYHCYHLASAQLAHSSFVRAGLRSPVSARVSRPSFACSPRVPRF